MRTFFATCGALALMIPVGLMQSENTNAQDGYRQPRSQSVRPFYRVRRYNRESNRQSAPAPAERCGNEVPGVPECETRSLQRSGCATGQCGAANCETCRMCQRDMCDLPECDVRQRGVPTDEAGDSRFHERSLQRPFKRSGSPFFFDDRFRSSRDGFDPRLRGLPNKPARPDVSVRGTGLRAGIQWRTDLRAANQESMETGLPILMKLSADWCGACQRMKHQTFADPALADVVNDGFIPIEIDIDRHESLARQLRIESIPTTLVISPDGEIVARQVGFQTVDQMERSLARFQPPRVDRPIARNRPAPDFSR